VVAPSNDELPWSEMRFFRWLASLWTTDRGFSVLLGSLVALIFVMPPLRSRREATLFMQIFFALAFVSGLSVSTTSRAARLVGTMIFAGAIALYWLDDFNPGVGLETWAALTRVLAVLLLTALALHQVFRAGPITIQRIRGAVAAYLLLGLTWANMYELIHGVWPDAFHFSEAPLSRVDLSTALAYYSFVTLTTVGYGDITPVHPIARSAAILEALAGQLFPAIFIARLVAMEFSTRQRGGES